MGRGAQVREAARFATASEAEVAASFLGARGVNAYVADRGLASVNPILVTALGGFRILTPTDQVENARRLLSEVAGREPYPEITKTSRLSVGDWIFRIVTALAVLITGNGYPGSSIRRSQGRLDKVQVAGLVLLALMVVSFSLILLRSPS